MTVPFSKSQTLITGVYRTGSTYLSYLINSHPQISATMYTVDLLRFIYNRYNPITQKSNILAVLDDLEYRLKLRWQKKLNKQQILNTFEKIENKTYGWLYDVIMCSLYLEDPIEHWAEKNQLLWREIPIFLDIMPNGKSILIVRDPRSILLSFKKFTYVPEPAYLEAIFNALDAMQYGLKLKEKCLETQFCFIRYEDAARYPETTACKIWNFLGLENNPQIIDQTKWIDFKGQPWYSNSSFEQKDGHLAFDVERSINRWQTELSLDEISFVEAVCGNIMQKYGYEKTMDKVNLNKIESLFANNSNVARYYRNWLDTGNGIESFPTDPLNPDNWRDLNNQPYIL